MSTTDSDSSDSSLDVPRTDRYGFISRIRPSISKNYAMLNLAARHSLVPQMKNLVDSYGEPLGFINSDHKTEIESTKKILKRFSPYAYDFYNRKIFGYTANTLIYTMIYWDNRIAFTIKDPHTDSSVIFHVIETPIKPERRT